MFLFPLINFNLSSHRLKCYLVKPSSWPHQIGSKTGSRRPDQSIAARGLQMTGPE